MADTTQILTAKGGVSRLPVGAAARCHAIVSDAAPAGWPRFDRGVYVPGAIVVVAAFVAAVALPLATYTTALALFGFAHVASELRYVDHRFGARLDGGLAGTLAVLLAIAVLLRLAGMRGWLDPSLAVGLEVGLGAILLGVTVSRMRQRRWIAVVAALVLIAGALLAPFETLLCFAIVHNLTPLGFLAEALRGVARWWALAAATVAFIVLPLLIATGLPFAWFAMLGLVAPEATLFSAGDLTQNLGAYVPASALYSDWALHAFAASVFAQCMHYIAVIGILPRLIGASSAPRLLWPDQVRFGRTLVIGSAALGLGFALDYGLQRQVYALAALVHAWLELPIFALALGSAVSSQAKSRP